MERECLKCEEEFQSEGIHNRICHECKRDEAFKGMASLDETKPSVWVGEGAAS